MESRNRYLEAFKESFNVIGLTTAVAASAATLNPLPLLIGIVAEAAYLLFVSDSRWYQVRLARKFDAEVEARRQNLKKQILPTLRPVMQARFLRLEEVRRGISDAAQDEPEWFREVLRKLDFLLEKWLHFAAKDVQFRDYLETALTECDAPPAKPSASPHARQLDPRRRGLAGTLSPDANAAANAKSSRLRGMVPPATVGPSNAAPNAAASNAAPPRDAGETWARHAVARVQQSFDDELSGLQQMAAAESDPTTRAVLEKRVEVLQRRREFVGKIGRIQINLNHQLNLLEDTFGLISDEIRARPPQQVLADIEDVVSQTNTMTQLLEEVAPYEQLLAS